MTISCEYIQKLLLIHRPDVPCSPVIFNYNMYCSHSWKEKYKVEILHERERDTFLLLLRSSLIRGKRRIHWASWKNAKNEYVFDKKYQSSAFNSHVHRFNIILHANVTASFFYPCDIFCKYKTPEYWIGVEICAILTFSWVYSTKAFRFSCKQLKTHIY